jgi:hypothetical protein
MRFLPVLLLFFLSFKAFSQATLLSTNVNQKAPRFNGFTGLSYSSNLYESNSVSSETYLSGEFMLNYRVQGANLIRATLSGQQQQFAGHESQLNDGALGWVNNSFWRSGEVLTIGQQVRAILPTSKNSRVRDEKIIGVSLAPVFQFNLTPKGLTGVMVIYQPQLIRNFHEYQQNRAYQNNVQTGLNQILAVAWSVTDRFYVQPSFVYGSSWSYGNVKRDDTYQFASELGYSFKGGITVNAGITNAGAIRNFENGNDQTIELFNNKTASVYSGLLYSF